MNVRTWRLERIRQLCDRYRWPAPAALQQEYSYLHRRPGPRHASIVGGEQLAHLREHPDLTLVAYSPVLKGRQLPRGDRAERQLAAVRQVADELGVLPSTVVLAWLAQHTPRVVPMIGTAGAERLDQAAAAAEIGLSTDRLERLAAVRAWREAVARGLVVRPRATSSPCPCPTTRPRRTAPR